MDNRSIRTSALAAAQRGAGWLLFALLAATACPALAADPALPRLRVSQNGRFLVSEPGRPVFLLCDTAWSLVQRMNRDDVEMYLRHRRAQGFNAVTFVLFTPGNRDITDTLKNAYGQVPFASVGGRPDPTQPLLTPGADPAVAGQYDFWDHVDYAVGLTKRLGLYAIMLPAWGSAVAGDYSGKPSRDQVFDGKNARTYGQWLGRRYGTEPHVLWMFGGDRRAVYGQLDYRPVFRALAQGLTDGAAGRGQLMSFHPPKSSPQSGDWFHNDSWLSLNSLQHWPEDQIPGITRDWGLTPPKPTWVFEPRYEGYWKKPYTAADWSAWQTRQQAYQSVFAGGFGFTYGHERVFGFGRDGWDWKKELDAPGASQMRHLAAILSGWSQADYLSRLPDQSLLDGDEGRAQRLASNRLTATRNGDATLAMIYSANGRAIRVRLHKLV